MNLDDGIAENDCYISVLTFSLYLPCVNKVQLHARCAARSMLLTLRCTSDEEDFRLNLEVCTYSVFQRCKCVRWMNAWSYFYRHWSWICSCGHGCLFLLNSLALEVKHNENIKGKVDNKNRGVWENVWENCILWNEVLMHYLMIKSSFLFFLKLVQLSSWFLLRFTTELFLWNCFLGDCNGRLGCIESTNGMNVILMG